MDQDIGAHLDHPWCQEGRCVYCGPCGVRLYSGRVPDGHPVWDPPHAPSAADRMRDLWGKDDERWNDRKGVHVGRK